MDWRELVRGTLVDPEPRVVIGRIYFNRNKERFLRAALVTDDFVRFNVGLNPLDIENPVDIPLEFVLARIAEGLLVVYKGG